MNSWCCWFIYFIILSPFLMLRYCSPSYSLSNWPCALLLRSQSQIFNQAQYVVYFQISILGDYPCQEILLQCVVLLAFLHHLTMCCFGWSLHLSYWTCKWKSRFCCQPHVIQLHWRGSCSKLVFFLSCDFPTNRDGKRVPVGMTGTCLTCW